MRDDLRTQLANLHEAIGAALALLRDGDTSAARALLTEALKGTTMHSYDPTPPIDPLPDPGPEGPGVPGDERRR